MANPDTVLQCKNTFHNFRMNNPNLSRQQVADHLMNTSVCQQLMNTSPGQTTFNRILSTEFDDPNAGLSPEPMALGSRRDTREVQRFKHDAWWRGFIVAGVLLLILGFIFYKVVLRGSKMALYIFIAVMVTYIVIGAIRTVWMSGIAGVGYQYGHIFRSGRAVSRGGFSDAYDLREPQAFGE